MNYFTDRIPVGAQQPMPVLQPTTPPNMTGARPASNSPKDPVSRLKEYCEKNKCKEQYDTEECDGHFMCSVTVLGKKYQGGKMRTKKEAKKDAAQKATNALKC